MKKKTFKNEDNTGYQESYNINPFDIEPIGLEGSIPVEIISEVSNHKNILKNIIKVKIKLKIFYYNPIPGKWNFLYTTCPQCGKRARIRKKNIGENRFKIQFIYCNDCKTEGIINTKRFVFCPKLHLITNRTVMCKNFGIKKKRKYFYCSVCGGSYLIMDCEISEDEKL